MQNDSIVSDSRNQVLTHLERFSLSNIKLDSYRQMSEQGYIDNAGKPPLRNPVREYDRLVAYWEQLPSEYKIYIQRHSSTLPPLHDECRLIIQIPIRFEAGNLERLLTSFMYQCNAQWCSLPEGMVEILLINNYFEGEAADETLTTISEIKKQFGANNIHCVTIVYPLEERYPLTLARRIAADLSVYRLISRSSYRHAVYFALEDGDLAWCDPRQCWLQISTFDKNPFLDAVRGQQSRCPWIICQNDLTTVFNSSNMLMDAYLCQPRLHPPHNKDWYFKWHRVTTSGWNCAITAEVYAMIGGYTHNKRIAEDLDLGERISILRGSWMGKTFFPFVSTIRKLPNRSEGSPRRWLLRAAQNVNQYDRSHDYANFYSRENESILRTMPDDDLLEMAHRTSRIARDNSHFFEDAFTEYYRLLSSIETDGVRVMADFTSFMRVSGLSDLDWSIVENKVLLLNIDNIREVFNAYRRRTPSDAPTRWRPVNRHQRVTWRDFV